MKTLENYLAKTSQHLFKFQGMKTEFNKETNRMDKVEDPENIKYMKVLTNGTTFTVLKFDKDWKVVSDKTYQIKNYKTISSKGKEYIDSYLKRNVLFNHGYGPTTFKISSISHFKAFNELLEDYLKSKNLKEAA